MDHGPPRKVPAPGPLPHQRRTCATPELALGGESTLPDRLDPVIDLLFGAFAQEVFAVQQDVMEHKKRLLEMAVQALLPAELTMPYPAHAVLHGRPLDAQTWTHRTRTTLSASHAMDVHDRVGKNFSFTPSDEFRLHVGGIKYVLLADKALWPRCPHRNATHLGDRRRCAAARS
ncbi:MAG: type VI secretion system baseplate subunit TssF [Flavobacteriales bacterium]|nr:type VI secretion system baseplate subunit TssF [Flavobacteriales bacterium]